MKSVATVPPVMFEAQLAELQNIESPISAMIFIVEDKSVESENNVLTNFFNKLAENFKSLLLKAYSEGNERRVGQLNYFADALPELGNISSAECKANAEVRDKVAKAFNRIYDRVVLEMNQFAVEGNTRRVVEMDYVLDDLKKLKAKAVEYGIAL